MTRKVFSLAGPAAALIAFKCPFCLSALAGIGAGIGSLMPFVQGLYWILIVGFGALFLGFLFRSWKDQAISAWVLGLGAVGFLVLIYQVWSEHGGFLSWLPAILLTTASVTSLFIKKKPSCCNSQTLLNEKNVLEPYPRESLKVTLGGMNMAKRKVEVFTSGCPVCEPVVDLVKKTACSSCDVVVYDLNAGCSTNECRDKAKKYGITRVPAVVVDGKLLDCCKTGTVSEQALRAAGVGAA